MDKINLSASMRNNLLSLQKTQGMMDMTQHRLSTGLKVNCAIDNPSSYYTASSLNDRAHDLSALLDSMGQTIQTVKAATTGIEKGIDLLEQAQAVVNQAQENPAPMESRVVLETRDLSYYTDQGYVVLTQEMVDNHSIGTIFQKGAKVVLGEDINLTSRGRSIVIETGLILEEGMILDGNGHTITYNDDARGVGYLVQLERNSILRNIALDYSFSDGRNSYTPASAVCMSGGLRGANRAEMTSVNIRTHGDYLYGVYADWGAEVTIDTTAGIVVDGVGSHKIYNSGGIAFDDPRLYDGKGNTEAILTQIGDAGLAAKAADSFYVTGLVDGANDVNFGQHKWYLPAINELAEVCGIESYVFEESYYGQNTINQEHYIKIQQALYDLERKYPEISERVFGFYNSSTEAADGTSWIISLGDNAGYCNSVNKSGSSGVRCFTDVSLSGDKTVPEIGDIMYDDLSYGKAADYDAAVTSGRVAVGVIVSLSEDGTDAKVMNLKDLRFSNSSEEGNFDPAHPYSGAKNKTQWVTEEEFYTNIMGIDDFSGQENKPITVLNEVTSRSMIGVNAAYTQSFNEILEQYDLLIGDASYKGVNLLKNDDLTVAFDKSREALLEIGGADASATSLGLETLDWKNQEDVDKAASEIKSALNALRSISTRFGNYYNIITTRQDFTEGLVNILTEGSDKLMLADMNEESVNMLALQTRQQLAINSLSLASQAAQGVLKLF